MQCKAIFLGGVWNGTQRVTDGGINSFRVSRMDTNFNFNIDWDYDLGFDSIVYHHIYNKMYAYKFTMGSSTIEVRYYIEEDCSEPLDEMFNTALETDNANYN